MTNLEDPKQLEHVLEALGANNTEIIRQAESILKPFVKSIQCIPALLHQIEYSSNVSVRHMAALILKKRINALYVKCSDIDKNNVKQNLLRLVTMEPAKPVRTAIAGAAASLAKNVFTSEGNWPEVFDLLIHLMQSQEESMRALCFNLLGQLSEHVAEHLKPHTQTIAEMILSGCNDPSHNVAVSALSASTIIIGSISDEPEVMIFQGVLSHLLQVMQKCLESGDEDVVAEGLDLIQECAAMEQPLVNDHIQNIVPFAVSIMGNFSLESSTRGVAGQTILSIIELRPKLLAKQNLVQPILEVFVQAIANSDSSGAGTLYSMGHRHLNEEDDDEDDDEYNPSMELTEIAQMCLDRMSLSMNSKSFVGPVLNIISTCMASPDKNLRKAGCAVLGIICEGCNDAIREILPDILPHLLEAVRDPEYYVRESACFALGQFSEHCQPEILYHHQLILPSLYSALIDERPTVQGTCCYVLENFCENLQPDTLLPFLPDLMQRLGQVLSSTNKTTQEMALAAIAATAVASEKYFLPYTEPIINVLRDTLFVSEPDMLNIRGRSLECLGHIAVAVGAENYAPYFDMGLQAAMQGVQIGEDSLKEYAYTYFANCAKVMKNTFDQHLETLVPHLLEVISESELAPFTEEPDILVGLDDDEFEDDEDNEQFNLTTHEGFINTKKAALCAIGSLADHTGASFYPYLETTLNTLLAENNGPLWSFHRIIRAEALVTLQYLVKVACLNFGPISPPGKGEVIELHPIVRECVIASLTTCINSMITDVEKLPAAYSIESLESILKLVGMAGMTIMDVDSNKSYGDLILQNILTLLKEKGKCQTVLNREQDDDEDDDDDHDNLVMDAVCDLIATLAKIIGEGYMPYFTPMVKHLMKFTKKNRPHTDRAMSIGCFAEVINEVGQIAGDTYIDTLLPILKEGVADSMESVRRNSAYCFGMLCIRSPNKVTPICLQILQCLYPLCIRKSDEILSDVGGADIDNALAAVSRMIISCQGVPLAQVLPVLFNALPIRSDFGEGQTVYQGISHLLLNNEPTIYNLLPQVLTLLTDTLVQHSKYNEETKVISIQTLKYLASEKHNVMMSALESIQSPEKRNEVLEIIQHAVNA